jgi:hypothetical protein
MSFVDFLERKMDDVYSFYATHKNGNEDAPQQKLVKGVYNHRFLGYSYALNWVWQPVYLGSAVISYFDKGENLYLKLGLMVATSPALVAGTVLFGAFWSKLGSKELLSEAWRQSKIKTTEKILINSVAGNAYLLYYKFHLFSKAVNRAADFVLEQTEHLPPRVGSGTLKTLETCCLVSRYFC